MAKLESIEAYKTKLRELELKMGLLELEQKVFQKHAQEKIQKLIADSRLWALDRQSTQNMLVQVMERAVGTQVEAQDAKQMAADALDRVGRNYMSIQEGLRDLEMALHTKASVVAVANLSTQVRV